MSNSVSVVIPTYRRENVLLDTLDYLLGLDSAPAEIIVVDQTVQHNPDTSEMLSQMNAAGRIRWLKLREPSITHAMNVGLARAQNQVVLFLDDDIIPGQNIVIAHQRAHQLYDIVAGQVLQPGESPEKSDALTADFKFRSGHPQYITEIMAGNFSIKRDLALSLGGFDENFIQVAYRFESEFARRALAAGEKIWFEPSASIRHLKSSSGGTRSFGHHLTTIRPSHAVGEYYYLFRSKGLESRWLKILKRPLRSIRTRHHLAHPWWIPVTLLAECLGFLWACFFAVRGPRLLCPQNSKQS